ncbi:MAG: ABC transporter ATP-binding protein [Phycisphaerae bacterium]|nr:ABC transporter ATP-binding protein [Phycisphaerae bacterium]
MLEAIRLSKTYPTADGGLQVLRDATLTLQAGDSAAVMGPSGCGKSTFLNILGVLDTPTGGTLRVDGRAPFDLPEADQAAFRNRSVGFVFQDHHLLPQCTVLENVLIPTLVVAGADELERARQLLGRVGLSERMDHRPAQLSGGERQRAAIARALINRPAVLLADEPTGNLDRANAERVADLLTEIHREEKTILVVVTHSEEIAGRFDRTMIIRDGVLSPMTQS